MFLQLTFSAEFTRPCASSAHQDAQEIHVTGCSLSLGVTPIMPGNLWPFEKRKRRLARRLLDYLLGQRTVLIHRTRTSGLHFNAPIMKPR